LASSGTIFTTSRALRLLQPNSLQRRRRCSARPPAGFCVCGICGGPSRTVGLCPSKIMPAHFVALSSIDLAVPRRNQMNTAPFEIIPAWRIARLRTALRDAEQRGANPDDEGHDLLHRALQRRFALARGHAKHRPRLVSRPKTTRKGRSFPHLKLVIIWRAILSCRSSAWKQGDTAPFGSIRRAHEQAVVACRAAGVAPPRYRTVYVLWHRGVPPADVVATLRGEDTNPTG
jgi:hypothetical protein